MLTVYSRIRLIIVSDCLCEIKTMSSRREYHMDGMLACAPVMRPVVPVTLKEVSQRGSNQQVHEGRRAEAAADSRLCNVSVRENA